MARTGNNPIRALSGSTTTRRRLVQSSAMAASAAASGTSANATTKASQEALPVSQSQVLGVSPAHQTRTASPGTTISFRGVTAAQLGHVKAVGDMSGTTCGVIWAHTDGKGVSFVPDSWFVPGERVSISADIPLTPDGSPFWFAVARPVARMSMLKTRETDKATNPLLSFTSRPDLAPPKMTITDDSESATVEHVFLTPSIKNGQSGPMILDRQGGLVWFHPLPIDTWECLNLDVQEYRGQPVLTFWQGVKTLGYGFGHFAIMNEAYEVVATIHAGNGHQGLDPHDCLITPRGTAIVVAYAPVHWNLSAAGGTLNGIALDGVVQEIDIDTGHVLMEWHALDHVDLPESVVPAPKDADTHYDYFHINSIALDDDGHLIVSGRHTDAIYKVHRTTGDVIWRLNGRKSDFRMYPGTPFAYQHDAQSLGGGYYSLFDNASNDQAENGKIHSRGLVLSLDTENMSASLVAEFAHPTNILSVSQGNMQQLDNGNVFVGWGSAPVYSEFATDGSLVYNGRFPIHVQSYRAFTHTWHGRPTFPPDIAVGRSPGESTRVYVSWNGATDVVTWRLLGGSSPDTMKPFAEIDHTGFEVSAPLPSGMTIYVAAEACDANNVVLGKTDVVHT